ncbi:hypothetical protein F4861DRAFT_335219 [Xylaria intraflava]|nr:hypothetical protein F4861DRAFT_335219 [Xylaria intraflava]
MISLGRLGTLLLSQWVSRHRRAECLIYQPRLSRVRSCADPYNVNRYFLDFYVFRMWSGTRRASWIAAEAVGSSLPNMHEARIGVAGCSLGQYRPNIIRNPRHDSELTGIRPNLSDTCTLCTVLMRIPHPPRDQGRR